MDNHKASRTALATAYLRAVHQLFDAPPLILEDPPIVALLGQIVLKRFQDAASRDHISESSELRAHIVLRSKFNEDRLAEAVKRGIRQYIILGAGFDTFALRQMAWARALKIYEVDHPDTQALKRSMIAKSGLPVPENLKFVGIDFEKESLIDVFKRNQISITEPSFFSWLGVTMYLNEKAIDAVLQSIAHFPAGSEIVLTFSEPPDQVTDLTAAPSPLAQRVASQGEPFISYFKPDEIELKLRYAGFLQVGFLSTAEARARYFSQRPPDLPVPKRTGLVFAIR